MYEDTKYQVKINWKNILFIVGIIALTVIVMMLIMQVGQMMTIGFIMWLAVVQGTGCLSICRSLMKKRKYWK